MCSPFGMVMPERKYSAASSYRYGFNGKENDNEVKGEGNQQDYGMRIYDTRLGRFLSVDPLSKLYPANSTYSFAENDVIRSIDLEGLEKVIVSEYYDKDNNLIKTKIRGIRDKETKQAVNMNLKSALNVKLTTDDIYLIKFDHAGKIFFEGPSGKMNEYYKKFVFSSNAINGEEDESLPDNTMQQSEVTTRGKFYKSALLDNSKNEFYEGISNKFKLEKLTYAADMGSFYLPGDGDGNPIIGKLGTGKEADEFLALPDKIKKDGTIKSIDVVIPMKINTDLTIGEQNNIRLAYEKMGETMRKVLSASGVTNISIQRVEKPYSPKQDSKGVSTNLPDDNIKITLKR